jgi:hypothetical protein
MTTPFFDIYTTIFKMNNTIFGIGSSPGQIPSPFLKMKDIYFKMSVIFSEIGYFPKFAGHLHL